MFRHLSLSLLVKLFLGPLFSSYVRRDYHRVTICPSGGAFFLIVSFRLFSHFLESVRGVFLGKKAVRDSGHGVLVILATMCDVTKSRLDL